MGQLLENLKSRARALKTETYALYLAVRDPRTPWCAKALAAFVVTHTFSPIDLIPDFIPVLGYLDDLIITPGGIWLALKMIPPEVMAECRVKAQEFMSQKKPTSWVGAAIVILIWLALVALCVVLVMRWIQQ